MEGHFSCVRLCATPWMAAHRAPPSLGFSRQEHWSGMPFPSPMQESEKWKWSHSVMSYSQRPHRLQPTRLLHPWDFPGKSTGVGCHCLTEQYKYQWWGWLGPISEVAYHRNYKWEGGFPNVYTLHTIFQTSCKSDFILKIDVLSTSSVSWYIFFFYILNFFNLFILIGD